MITVRTSGSRRRLHRDRGYGRLRRVYGGLFILLYSNSNYTELSRGSLVFHVAFTASISVDMAFAVRAQDRPPRESDTNSEQEQTIPTVKQTEEHIGTFNQTALSSASRKREPSHLLLEKIEKRMAANQQQIGRIVHQEDNPRATSGRMVGLSVAQIDDEAFEGLQMDVTTLLVKKKRESRARAEAALVTQAPARPPPMHHMPPGATTRHTVVDSPLASGIAAQQNQQCPRGFIPDWQH
ncbi:hypothetical protein ScPMuIL_016092 [Solemya velum]